MPGRLTRKAKQAQTRFCLIRAAGRVFARRGLQQASIEEVAEDAGYSRGAFYANFQSKEELFLAMLDERFSERLKEVDDALTSENERTAKTRQVGTDFTQALRSDPEWSPLFFELAAYAARNEEFREELVVRYRPLRERVAEAIRRTEELAGRTGVPPEDIAIMTCAMANGFAVEKMLEPDAVPDDIFGEMLIVFFAGLHALAQSPAGEAFPRAGGAAVS
jgi:AcrR family transcriptional regulator